MSELYLPYIGSAPMIAGQFAHSGSKAYELFLLMRDHPAQKRRELVWVDRLQYAAYRRCYAQAHEGWTGHVAPDGQGPNELARSFGYRLPDYYGRGSANNIESLSHGGVGTVEQTWEHWLLSEGHRIHLLGLDPFYARQTNVGVGYYYLESSPKKHYWCVLSAPPESE